MKINTRAFIFSLVICFISTSVFATSLLPLDLTELHKHAQDILVVEAVNNVTQKDAATGLIVTYSKFKVLDTVKGTATGTYTIKQVGGILPDDSNGLKVPGVPTFTSGKKYILFVPPASNLGFASPVGLEQGKFTVTNEANTEVVSNGRDLDDLTATIPRASMPASVKSHLQALPNRNSAANKQLRTKLPLNEFLTLIRSIK